MSDPITLFIVEDHPIVRAGLRCTLESIKRLQIVGECDNGRTAIERVMELKPAITLMDITLPELDGIEAVQKIKEQWADSRIIMLTNHEDEQYVFASLAAGADGYFLKNSNAAQLELAIDTVRSGSIWLDPGIARQVLHQSMNVQVPDPLPPDKTHRGRFDLSPREIEVLKLLVDGKSNQQIASELIVSIETVKTHIRHILEKLVVSDRTQAAVKAVRQGLV